MKHKDATQKIIELERDLPKFANKADKKLLRLLLDIVLSLDTKDGILQQSSNWVVKLKAAFGEAENQLAKDLVHKLIQGVEQSHLLNEKYYQSITGRKKKVNLGAQLGYKGNKLTESSFIGQSFLLDVLYFDIKTLFLQSIASFKSVIDLKKSVITLVKGAIVKRVKQILPTILEQINRLSNFLFAKKHKLNHFIYTNSIIVTSREFCREKAGKVFSINDAEEWINDPNLPLSNKWKLTYKPLIHMGGFNCRHFPKFITAETAKKLGYNEKK